MNIYLDIDGVLLANEKYPALYVHEFLQAINRFPTYWLTTHCRGDADHTVHHLSRVLPEDTLALTKSILPTNWIDNKTEAIDFDQPFLWFDDELYPEEKQDLLKNRVFANWIEVDLAKNPVYLKKLADELNMIP